MNKKLDYIDAIRGLAILGVIVTHTAHFGTNHYPAYLDALFASGAKGVQLFFIASAFTLFLSFKNRSTGELHPVRYFFIRRFFRIAPMYYLGILYYLWQTGFWDTHSNEHIKAELIVSNIFFVHGIHPSWINNLVPGGWSISVEMMFYCLVPVLYKKITSLNKAVIGLAGFIFFNLLLQIIFKSFAPATETWQGFLYFFLPNQMPVFMCGIIGYFLIARKDHRIKLLPLLMLAIALTADAVFRDIRKNPLLPGFIFLLLLYLLSHYKSRLLVNPAMAGLGKISFSSYLVHFAVLYGLIYAGLIDFVAGDDLFHSLLNFSIRLVLVLGLTSLIAAVFYRLVELPMQKLGKKLIKHMETAARKQSPVSVNKEAIPVDALLPGKSIKNLNRAQ